MAEKAVDTSRDTAEGQAPGKPIEGTAVSQMGATFAERSGKKAPSGAKKPNSTFADRAKAAGKQVKNEDAEDKAVTSASTKAKK